MFIMRIPEEKKNGTERLFEQKMAESFPNLMKNINLQIERAQETAVKIDTKIFAPRHNIVKL